MSAAPNLYDAEPIPDAAHAEVERLLRTGDLFRYTAPENAPVALLEGEFAEFIGSRFALAVSSCSAALFLTLRALDLPAGARVLIPGFTFAAVPSAVMHAGCVPVLAEVGVNYRVEMSDFMKKIDDDIAAVMISHMRGHTSDMDAIMAACDARGIPVIEDAAHSLGTTWKGRNIGTIGRAGCFSFQSYKLVNAGEGGMLVTDDAGLIARAVIMSGAYEHNWRKHPGVQADFAEWQNRLPLYNIRMSNIAAALIRPQLPEVARRVRDGRANHDYLAMRLNRSPHLDVPPPLPGEVRAPDSIQFNLVGFERDEDVRALQEAVAAEGVALQVFGLSHDNARAFWNWQFMDTIPDLPLTRAMLMRACDLRLPARLTRPDIDFIAETIICGAERIRSQALPAMRYGT